MLYATHPFETIPMRLLYICSLLSQEISRYCLFIIDSIKPMDKNIEQLSRSLERNSPLLFLGAGFCFGAKLKTGADFPRGDDLKIAVLTDHLGLQKNCSEYQDLIKSNLLQVCQYASIERSESHLDDFLVELFSNGSAAPYHFKLTSYNWRKVYSTNIDDIIEYVYRTNGVDLLIQDSARKKTVQKNATELFKLHGSVNNPNEGFVFSSDQYVNSMIQRQDYRFSTLTYDMNSEDFIFIGSEFEEINISYYLTLYEQAGYKSSKGKLFFINPYPSAFFRAKIKKIGGILIEWTADQFLNHLEAIAVKTQTFLQQNVISFEKSGFVPIKKLSSDGLKQIYDSDLYLGFEPKWEDIFFEWDFLNSDLLYDFEKFIDSLHTRNTGIFSITGKAFSGKSVFIKRLAVELINKDFEVFYFKGRSFNPFDFYRQILDSDLVNFALVMDDSSYHYKSVKQLVNFNLKGKNLVVLTTSRPFYHFRKRYHFVEEHYKEFAIEPKIDTSYAKAIVSKLAEKGFLGQLKGYTDYESRIQLVKSQNDLFSLLSFITQGAQFKERMLKEIVPMMKNNPLVNDLLLKTAVFEELDLPFFPKELITTIYGSRTIDLLSLADDFLKFNENGDIQFRAKFYSHKLISANTKTGIINTIAEILEFISPQIPPSHSRHDNTYWSEIQEALTKQRLLKSIFNFTNLDIKQLLLKVKAYYSDNSHYWLQLGISEQSLGEFGKAFNHFKQAEALNPDSYIIKHAIGRNFMKEGNNADSKFVAKPLHDQGEKILLDLIERHDEYSARAFATHSYLYDEINYVEKFDLQVSNGHLKKLFSFLKRITDKDPDDVMAKHMTSHFYKFLNRINKPGVINIHLSNLQQFKAIFQDYNFNIEQLLENQDF